MGDCCSDKSCAIDALGERQSATLKAASLYAVSRGSEAKARVALFKGSLILAAGLFSARPSSGSTGTTTST